jgi:hypothetical protein
MSGRFAPLPSSMMVDDDNEDVNAPLPTLTTSGATLSTSKPPSIPSSGISPSDCQSCDSHKGSDTCCKKERNNSISQTFESASVGSGHSFAMKKIAQPMQTGFAAMPGAPLIATPPSSVTMSHHSHNHHNQRNNNGHHGTTTNRNTNNHSNIGSSSSSDDGYRSVVGSSMVAYRPTGGHSHTNWRQRCMTRIERAVVPTFFLSYFFVYYQTIWIALDLPVWVTISKNHLLCHRPHVLT